MLLIFDLDDTLIDTTNSTRTPKLLEALESMIRNGLKIPNLTTAESDLLKIDQVTKSGEESLTQFGKKYEATEKIIQTSISVYFSGVDHLNILPLPHAITVVSQLQKHHTLIIVSTGEEKTQLQKIKKAGLSTELFSEIIIIESYHKGLTYQEIVKTHTISPQNIVVIGDKVATDLLPAKKLGFNTIHMRHGRGANDLLSNQADYQITTLSQIPAILINMQSVR